jgi:hypothetical protein
MMMAFSGFAPCRLVEFDRVSYMLTASIVRAIIATRRNIPEGCHLQTEGRLLCKSKNRDTTNIHLQIVLPLYRINNKQQLCWYCLKINFEGIMPGGSEHIYIIGDVLSNNIKQRDVCHTRRA